MACKSLILGIIFSIGIFAVKSGVGLQYFLSRTPSARAKTGAWLIFALTYLSVFGASGLILAKLDLMNHLTAIQAWIQSGMTIHLIMAGMLLLWGIRLLRQRDDVQTKSHGWLLLAIPCPVCATAIFLSLGFLTACYPDRPVMTAGLLFLVFLTINLATVWVMSAGTRTQDTPPEVVLGGAMLLIAVYFLLSVTVMPQFADADKIYRMSLASSETPPEQLRHLAFFGLCIVITFMSGFGSAFLNIRRAA
ncbi:hypothetical protein DENIS_3518 [Desulfonema ishimotonii]|uniref:Transporter n=1 Tax=Desulfonema ishimotonii TaxID=45657 RepID=A0A401G034_9BACT|nr:DUF2162 domain-containing protein [Desulfonema ishimotonii]GBC62546.1 hypothetical protein DENIS_3518 [Desulfonema ishimotonii]